MHKALFLKLIKVWHPDTTTNLHTKRVYEEMSKAINRACEAGDRATLEAIDLHGEAYLGRGSEPDVSGDGQQAAEEEMFAERSRRMQAAAVQSWYAWTVEPPRISYFPVILRVFNPYLLPMSMSDWGSGSRIYNLFTILSGTAWLGLWWLLWKQLWGLEAAAQATGFTHEGGVGLLFVLARGIMILAALPVAIPLGGLAAISGVSIGAAFITCWLVGNILAVFHPWLVNAPYVVASILLPSLLWTALGED